MGAFGEISLFSKILLNTALIGETGGAATWVQSEGCPGSRHAEIRMWRPVDFGGWRRF